VCGERFPPKELMENNEIVHLMKGLKNSNLTFTI